MEIKFLHRYTSLPFLLEILKKERLTLVDPKKWDDTNDSYLIELYRNKARKKSVLLLCFAQYIAKTVKAEKYHHWKIYSGSLSGVCIKFKKQELISHFKSELGANFRHDVMKYKTIKRFEEESKKLTFNDLPFIKRKAFNDEREYRFLYESKEEHMLYKEVSVPLDFIAEITFNPWLPVTMYKSQRNIIKHIISNKEITINRSTCLDYERWKNTGDKIARIN